MQPNWPLIVAIGLILLKQTYKLYLNHVPDRVDYLKAISTLPLDVMFLIVALFIKAAAQKNDNEEQLVGLLVLYFLASVASALLWRVSDNSIKSTLGWNFAWAFPLNLAVSSTSFYLALTFVG